jgi:hypothetical protein
VPRFFLRAKQHHRRTSRAHFSAQVSGVGFVHQVIRIFMILPLTSGTNNGGQSGRLIAKEETQDELELTSHKLVRNLIRIFIPDSEKMFTYLFHSYPGLACSRPVRHLGNRNFCLDGGSSVLSGVDRCPFRI